MPSVRCRYINCVYLDEGYCSSPKVEIDPDEGCLTFSSSSDLIEDTHDDWSDEDELEEWDELSLEDMEEDESDLWLDDDEDY